MASWQQTIEASPVVWMTLAAVNTVALLACWRIAQRRMRRAGQRTANRDLVAGRARARDTALTVASMVPAVLFWAVVLAGSFRGLVAFGRDTLGWHHGWEYLVPGSLDGVSVTFALLAFRAVRKQKAPDRCYRVVWGAAIGSAVVNFDYEYQASGHNLVAGGYLALLSLFGMVMFHEFLHQFQDGTGYVRRENPRFGLRWITWPTNTFCAAVAWRNHPPARGTTATVRNAVANLERVRALKHATRETASLTRHQRALARARRRSDLTAATGTGRPDDQGGRLAAPANRPPGHRPAAAGVATRPAPAKPAAGVRVPGTAWRVRQWVDTWVRMCADGGLVVGPINDDGYARATYRASSRHLADIRKAALTGALRRRASELGVPLPAGFVDDPTRSRLNGRARAPA
jgi:hypothetical protein